MSISSEQHIDADINLRITVVDEFHDKTYKLNFPGSHTVMQVKRDVATVTDIAVFRQSWTGWPEGCNDQLSLIQIGLESDCTLRLTSVRRHDDEPGPSMPVLDDTIVLDDTALEDDVDITDDEYQVRDDISSLPTDCL